MATKRLVFAMTVDTTLEFWERVIKEGLTSEEQRIKLLIRMMQEGKVDNVIETARTKEQLISDYAKHYNKICDLTSIKGDELE